MLNVQDVYTIVQAVYAGEGFKPGAGTTREQRNAMWDAALACVYYGHPRYNTAGGDTRWMNKRATPSSPATDDVVVFAPTREYWDFITDAGAASWRFALSGHADLLPASQVLFAPDVRSLPPVSGTPIIPPTVTTPPQPPAPPAPTVCSAATDVATLKAQMTSIVELLQIVVSGQAALGGDLRGVEVAVGRLAEGIGDPPHHLLGHLVDIKSRVTNGVPAEPFR
jgi:hypothetical protein